MLEKFLTLIFLLVSLTCCQKTVNDSYVIDKFSPIETVITDWEERKRTPFYTTYNFEDGTSIKSTSGETFECNNAENYYSDVKSSGPKALHTIQVSNDNKHETSLTLPNKLDTYLKKIKSNVTENENPKNGITVFSMMYPPVDFLEFLDGWMVAYSGGEWGGMLLWVGIDGEHRVLDGHNTNDLIQHNGRIYSAHGVDHMITAPEHMKIWSKTEYGFENIFIPTPSAVESLDAQKKNIVGLMSHGIIYLEENGAVHYRRFSYKEPLGFIPKKVGFLPSGDVYISGNNVVGVYDSLPEALEPKLYIPTNCEVIFEKEIPFSPNN